MKTIDPAALELPPTEPIDMTALIQQALAVES
ncbi:hypothetical protein J2Y42_000973 [Leifsonia sp. 1010]|nr:hypothetical protein [Leifsonia sp. 1010]